MAQKKEKKKMWLSKLDAEKKVIIINWSIDPTPAEEKKVEYYTKAGYVLKDFSAERSKTMKEKADGINKETIIKALEDKPDELKIFTDKLNEKGFFYAKSWYLHEYKGIPRKTKKK
jgi:hypothetical protein